MLYAAAVISFRERFSRPPEILGSLLLSRSGQGRIQFSPLMDLGGHSRPLSMSTRIFAQSCDTLICNNARRGVRLPRRSRGSSRCAGLGLYFGSSSSEQELMQ